MSKRTPRKKKTSFVPRVVFRVAVTGVGVVPLCVAATLSTLELGCVAASCYGDSTCYPGVADTGFADAKTHHDGAKQGVADVGFADVKHD